MNVSPNGRAMIERFEGVVLRRYNDFAGIPSIGVGHRILPSEMALYPVGCTITSDQADAILANDLRVSEAAVTHNVTALISQNAFDACCSLAFNIGGSAFATSTVCRRINAGDMQGAADAFLLWEKYTDPKSGALQVSAVLLARREAERALFLRDVSTTDDA